MIMTSEENNMLKQCKKEYQAMMTRIESVVTDKWPETLSGDGAVWPWLDDKHPELRTKYREVSKRLNEAWQNGMLVEFKKLVTEWGKIQLEIFKLYAAHLKQETA